MMINTRTCIGTRNSAKKQKIAPTLSRLSAPLMLGLLAVAMFCSCNIFVASASNVVPSSSSDRTDSSMQVVKQDINTSSMLITTELHSRHLKNQVSSHEMEIEWLQLGDAIVGQAADESRFGSSVATSKNGDTIVVGAPYYNLPDGSMRVVGYAQVFKYNVQDDKWHQIGGDTIYGDAVGIRYGLYVAMNDDGDIIAIGNKDYVRVYQYKKSLGTKDAWDWVQMGQDLYGPPKDDDYTFFRENVWTIALSGHGRRVMINGISRGGFKAGLVKVYEYIEDDEKWEQVGEDIDWENEYDSFPYLGAHVDMSKDGDAVIVGTRGWTSGVRFRAGYVRIYRFENTKWTQQGQVLGGQPKEKFGYSVAVSRNGSRVVIVNAGDGYLQPAIAQVYEYNRIVKLWEQVGENIQGGFKKTNYSFTTVDMNGDGDAIILGGPNNDDEDIDDRRPEAYYGRGNVRIYRCIEGNWIQQGQTIEGSTVIDDFGGSVAISQDGERIVVGGPTNSDNGEYSGLVRVYQVLVKGGDGHGNGNGNRPTPKPKRTKTPKSAKVNKGGKKKNQSLKDSNAKSTKGSKSPKVTKKSKESKVLK